MDKKDIKYLVLDIDGTLTNSEKEITPKTKEGIIRVMERGHKVILASGRPTAGMMRYAEELEFGKRGGYLLAFNGGCIFEYKTGNVLFQKTNFTLSEFNNCLLQFSVFDMCAVSELKIKQCNLCDFSICFGAPIDFFTEIMYYQRARLRKSARLPD